MASPVLGRFIDVQGLAYRSGSFEGVTNARGDFQYYEGDDVSFKIGNVLLGTTRGKRMITVLDLVSSDASIDDPSLLNRARLLFSLTNGQGFEKPIVIDDQVERIVSKYASSMNLDDHNTSALDIVLSQVGDALKIAPKSIPHVRNHLRRAKSGFKVLRDLRIPVRDGSFVLGDVYLPLGDEVGRFPVLVSSTIYGKRIVYSGPNTDDPDDVAAFERSEDLWHTTPAHVPLNVPNTGPWFGKWAQQRRYETIGTFNTFRWVPNGYAMVKIDPRGISQTPGTRGILHQESNDLFDAVEWAAEQPWSTGNVALAGNSYGANCQWEVVKQQPRGLKAFIPYATDIDNYREVSYIGGIPVLNYLSQWFGGVRAASPRWKDTGNLIEKYESHPFYDSYWDEQSTARDPRSITIPVFLAASQVALVHTRGSYEAFRCISCKDTYLQVVDGNYYGWPNTQVFDKLLLFADRHLKNIEHQSLERVGMQMRTGEGRWYWRTEEDWPVPGTKYVKFHLAADGSLQNFKTSGAGKEFSYSAETEPKEGPAGVSFVSDAFKEDIELAGHFSVTLNVSSTSHDADVVILLWAMDESGNIVRFCVDPRAQPLANGFLRASHRKMDIEKSLPWRPWHTHKEADYAPLVPGEAVELSVEICPATALIRRGWKLRLDITPSEEQPDVPGYEPRKLRSWGKEFHDGATNTVHVGGHYDSFISIPVVPQKYSEETPLLS